MRNQIYIRFSAIFFIFFLGWALTYTMITIWFGQVLHLSGAGIGTLFSINAIFTMTLQFLYGYLLDKFGTRKNILIYLGGVLLLTGPFFIYVYKPLLQTNFLLGGILGGIFLGGSYLASMGAVESYVEKISRKYDFEYGKVRMWGSLGTAIGAFFAGHIFNFNPNFNFWIGTIAAAIVLLILFSTRIDVTETEIKDSKTVKVRDIFELIKLKNFWIFVFFILGIASMNTIYDQQFPRFFAQQFATVMQGNQMYGYLNSAQTFLEVGMMFLAPMIVNKIGVRTSMLLVGAIFAVRIVLTGLAAGPILISIVKLVQGLDLPLMYIAIFKYIHLNFETRLSSILYLVGFQFMSQFGVIMFSRMTGRMYDLLGYQTTYLYLGIIVSLFVVIAFFTLNKDSEALNG